MDDKPEQEEPKKDFNKLDLNQLQSFSFGTQWTQEKAAPGGGGRSRDDRPRRDGPRDDRKDRRGFKRPSGPPREGAGRPGGGGAGGERRPQNDNRGQGPRGRSGESRGPFRGNPDRQQAHMGPYISPYFDATFYPEDVSFAALAKTIRASCRTFELFDIAKTVIAKQDRFVVVLDRKPAKSAEAPKRPFYVSMPDSVPFETEEEAVNHVMQKHLDRFFRTEEVETDPPKGSFQVINKCGVTGELLGPPNYHLYNQTVQQHHATRLARMPFETFKSRIESVREPEVIEAWLELMKKVTRYTWVGDGTAPAVAAPETSETAVTAAAPDAAPAETPASTEASESSDATVTEAPAAEAPAPEAAAAEDTPPAPVAAEEVSFDSINEAKVFLLTKIRDKVVRTFEHGRFHGRELANMPDGEIKRAVLGALERQQRFPLDSANALRGRLRREGFTIFKKGSKGVSYVCAVKRKFRVPGQTFADSIDQLITFIEKNPMVKVGQLPEKFLNISSTKPVEKKPATPVVEEPASEAEAPAAPTAGEEKPAEAAAPAPVEAPAPEKVELSAEDQGRLKRMTLDLRWLVTEGYVTEFIDGGLFAAAPIPPAKPKPKPQPKPKAAAKAPAVEAQDSGAEAVAPAAAEAAAAEPTPAEPTPEATPSAAEAEPEVSSRPEASVEPVKEAVATEAAPEQVAEAEVESTPVAAASEPEAPAATEVAPAAETAPIEATPGSGPVAATAEGVEPPAAEPVVEAQPDEAEPKPEASTDSKEEEKPSA